MKTIAVFFEVNDDTNSEAFGKWLDTCPFSNSFTVDYNTSTEPDPVDDSGSPSGADALAYGAKDQVGESAADAPNVDNIAEGDVSEVTEADAEKAVDKFTDDESAEEQKQQE